LPYKTLVVVVCLQLHALFNEKLFLMKGKIDYCIVNNGSEIIIALPLTNDKKD
jgi:hypothetical protein